MGWLASVMDVVVVGNLQLRLLKKRPIAGDKLVLSCGTIWTANPLAVHRPGIPFAPC